jgi:hypothetical protein
MSVYPNRSENYMKEMWGTTRLITDPHSLPSERKNPKMLREINEDEMTPKKHDFKTQNEIHERIRNDEDYDDWSYGTEPLFG